jgi:membrane associated rhomboid family serine protease
VHVTLSGLPLRLDALLTPLIETKAGRVTSRGDRELEAAVRELVAALNRLPAFRYGFQPGAPRIDRAFSHMFVHGGWGHLLGNMLFLWLAGGVLECFWRRWAYLALYFASGLAGLAAHFASAPSSLTPVVGASGAIAGLLGAFLVGYPRTRIKVAWFVFLFAPLWGMWRVPAWVLIPLWAGIEIVSAYFGGEDSGVAHWAHVGGFACGALVAFAARRANLVATDAGHEAVPSAPIAATRTSKSPGAITVAAHVPEPLHAHSLPVPPPRVSARPLEIEADSLPAASDEDVIER